LISILGAAMIVGLVASVAVVQLAPREQKAQQLDGIVELVEGVDFNGYIIEFHDPPAGKIYSDFKNQINNEDLRNMVTQEKATIAQTKERFLSDLNELTSGFELLSSFDTVFSGIVVSGISENTVNELRSNADVKGVYRNIKLEPLLYESIPLIDADDVWLLDTAGNACGGLLLSPPIKQALETQDVSVQCQDGIDSLNDIITNGLVSTTDEIKISKCSDAEISRELDNLIGDYIQTSNQCTDSAASDIDGDGIVGTSDLLAVLSAWGPNPGNPADIDGDGIVGTSDLLILLANWGPVVACDCLTGEGVTIAILDDGIDYTHPDFGSCTFDEVENGNCEKVSELSWDFIGNDNNPFPSFNSGHGTAAAAIAAGDGVADGTILKGVAPDARIVAYRVSQPGEGWQDRVIGAIELASDPNQDEDLSDHLDVFSISLGARCVDLYGGYNAECGPDDPMGRAIDNAVDIGIVGVVSAGNEGPGSGTITSPGTSRKAITVGASTKVDTMASYSSRGPVDWTDANGNSRHLNKPDVVAPAGPGGGTSDNICSAQFGNYHSDDECFDDAHILFSGTSAAAPHVAGAAALLIQQHPDWTAPQVKQALMDSAKNIGNNIIQRINTTHRCR